jgi:hypothetical protein
VLENQESNPTGSSTSEVLIFDEPVIRIKVPKDIQEPKEEISKAVLISASVGSIAGAGLIVGQVKSKTKKK